MDLSGKTVIITGASEGIGASSAFAFAKENCNVVLGARNVQAIRSHAAAIGENRSLAVKTDITCRKDIQNLVKQTIKNFKNIDILVNNAGCGLISNLIDIKSSDLHTLFETNFYGPLYLIQEVVPHMKEQRGGIIINVSSMITRIATKASSGYRASKMALDALSDGLRLELIDDNIRVITVYPGLTRTNFFKNSLGITHKDQSKKMPTLKGRSSEYVAQRLVSAARKEPRIQYMSLKSQISSVFALLFPALIEKLVQIKITGPSRKTLATKHP
jgi:short-subunit dehydrogenase